MDLILLIAFTAMILMTAFSYVYSRLRNKRFKQPPLLNELFARLGILSNRALSVHPAGWIIHYGVGVFFIYIFEVTRQRTAIEVNFITLLIAGALFGVVGALGWYATSRIHPKPPAEIKSPEFYLHIFIAHIVFATGAYFGYQLLPKSAVEQVITVCT